MRIVLGAVVPLVLVLGACGSNEVEDRPSAAQRACDRDAKTLLPAMEAAVPEEATFRMTTEMSGLGIDISIEAVGALTPGGAEMELTISGDGEFSAVLVDDRLFVAQGPDAPFQEVDDSDPEIAAFRARMASMDPRSSFAPLKAGLRQVHASGEETIDGERVCRYTVEVDSAAAATANGEVLPPGMPETIEYEYFLTEADDLIRRVVFAASGLRTEMNMTDWNEPVDIRVPAGF